MFPPPPHFGADDLFHVALKAVRAFIISVELLNDYPQVCFWLRKTKVSSVMNKLKFLLTAVNSGVSRIWRQPALRSSLCVFASTPFEGILYHLKTHDKAKKLVYEGSQDTHASRMKSSFERVGAPPKTSQIQQTMAGKSMRAYITQRQEL